MGRDLPCSGEFEYTPAAKAEEFRDPFGADEVFDWCCWRLHSSSRCPPFFCVSGSGEYTNNIKLDGARCLEVTFGCASSGRRYAASWKITIVGGSGHSSMGRECNWELTVSGRPQAPSSRGKYKIKAKMPFAPPD